MNRAERRRRQKQAKKAAKNQKRGRPVPASDLQALLQRGAQLHQDGQRAEAEAIFRQILDADPGHADANHLMGVAALQTGDYQGAAEWIAKTLDAKPDFPEALSNLGVAFKELGRNEEAAESYRKAIAVRPAYPEAHCNLGVALKALARAEEAISCYRRAIELKPDYDQAHFNLGNALFDLGRMEDAAGSYRKAIAIRSDYTEAYCNLGALYQDWGKYEDAAANCRKALEVNPGYTVAHNNLGAALQKLGMLEDAAQCFRKAAELDPGYADAHSNLGSVFKELGRAEDAMVKFRDALAIDPDLAKAHSNLLVTMPFLSSIDAGAVLAEARLAGAALEAPFKDRRTARHANDPDPDRRLRVGYLSPSLAEHVLAKNMEPVLKAHNRDNVFVHVYAHVPNPDEVTRRLEALADSWTFVHGLSDDRLADRIMEDGIDILVDPMGHWAGNRLSVFARKPAPIQVSYLSQGMTTGLASMDYTIGDRWLNFDGAMQAFATEQVVELPGGFEVKVPDRELPVGEPPSAENGFVTFASFNNPAKISDASLKLWAAVLDRVPEARLLIKGKWLDRPEKRTVLSKRLEDFGIAAERVDLLGFVPGPDHLGVHNRADIMLDTLPFAGGQTTVDALWMGVPVVTLIGPTVCGRYGYSHLNRVGVPELAARNEAAFVEIATTLAGDAGRLGHYRQTLRPALKASSLFDAPRHVGELEDAYRVMWRRWCEGLEPEAFAGFDKEEK